MTEERTIRHGVRIRCFNNQTAVSESIYTTALSLQKVLCNELTKTKSTSWLQMYTDDCICYHSTISEKFKISEAARSTKILSNKKTITSDRKQ